MIKKGTINVQPFLPDNLFKLKEISYNLWWSYNPDLLDLLMYIDEELLEKCNNSPFCFLNSVSTKKLLELEKDASFMEKYDSLVNNYTSYMTKEDTWFGSKYPEYKDKKIAYFSAEYGIHEILPTYSGGLGVLSGDHLKSSSDMGIPLVAVGLFYKHGYFTQIIDANGWQQSGHSTLDPKSLPMTLQKNDNGDTLFIEIEFPGRIVYLNVWSINVGRIDLYFLDSDNEKNNVSDRDLTSSLYGGNNETRIQQEILMGIGGTKLLTELGIECDIYHLNEGHQAFVILELLKKYIKETGSTFSEATQSVRSKTIFTTHTPVPAGIDVFPVFLIDKYLSKYRESFKLTREEFFSLAANFSDFTNFNMAILALNFSLYKNGVSSLHERVSKELFSKLWYDVPVNEIPITHVTNGVHTLSWLNPELRVLFSKYLGSNWETLIHEQSTWDKVDDIPDKDLWNVHCEIKKRSIDFFRDKIAKNKFVLNPKALTIGFARRFATYKRATLIFKDLARIEKILNKSDMPVQLVFAGKAHPADRQGQELIKRIVDISKQAGFKGSVLFLENYNIEVARHLVQGVDIWLNNPRRPLEASGTSGQKASLNGVINMSVLDGWWAEGYNGDNGFIIGDNNTYTDHALEDELDSISIYSQLEETIVPLYYDLDKQGVPTKWVELMKESIKTTACRFSSDRMIADYTENLYIPTIDHKTKMLQDNNIKNLTDYIANISKKWGSLNIYSFNGSLDLGSLELSSQSQTEIFVDLYLAGIDPNDISVELCYERDVKEFKAPLTQSLVHSDDILNGCHRFHAVLPILDTGKYIYSFRILPKNELVINKFDLKLIRWA